MPNIWWAEVRYSRTNPVPGAILTTSARVISSTYNSQAASRSLPVSSSFQVLSALRIPGTPNPIFRSLGRFMAVSSGESGRGERRAGCAGRSGRTVEDYGPCGAGAV